MVGFARLQAFRAGGVAVALLMLACAQVRADGVPGSASRGSHGETDWSGFYLGGQLGGAWSSIDWTQTNANFFNTLGPAVLGTDTGFHASSAAGGVLGGYNHQIDHLVLGFELGATALDLSDRRPSPFFPALDTYSTKVGWLATVAGRIGFAWDQWLVYGRGGWAGGNVEVTLDSPAAGVFASKDSWANGWTLGAGGEYMLWPGIALGLAYDYVDLSLDETTNCPACGVGVGFGTPVIDADYKIQSVMARLSVFLPHH
jgi:outer membrane immunogenic protein